MTSQYSQIPVTWNLSADVVVVGFGLAGAVAAIEAHDQGASVILLEKMSEDGGISRIAGGGARVAKDWEDAFADLKLACAGRTPDDVLEALARGMVEIPDYMEKLAATDGAKVSLRWEQGNNTYPGPGMDTWGGASYGEIPDYDPVKENPHSPGYRGGARMMKVMRDNVQARNIDVRLDTPARRLIVDGSKQVLGVRAEHQGREITVKASKAVVLTCGGFEGDQEMIKHYFEAQPLMVSGFMGNTGDGIRMAQELGADLWHMWHFHGSYGFLMEPDSRFTSRTFRKSDWLASEPPGRENTRRETNSYGAPQGYGASYVLPWILLDNNGKRYMNEYPPYLQDIGHRPMAFFDSLTQSYPRIPSHLLIDDNGFNMDQIALVTVHDPTRQYEMWSDDNLKELQKGILKQADTIEDVALDLGMRPEILVGAVNRWNDLCDRGLDEDFGRPPASLVPIEKPPFTYGEVWPMITNTHGGPRHDAHQRVLDVWGEPISRLYAAGELGGAFGHLYLSGGNFSECFVGGWNAARHAVTLREWDTAG